ncbi:MAG: hypothetical protein U0R24_07280 [Solirubrobacterales bacterium]
MTAPELDGRSLLAALVASEIDFIVIGGLAVGAHGFPRATKGIDIVPSPERANLERLATLLDDLDYEILALEEFGPDEVVRPDLDGLLGGGSWVLRTRFGRLGILQHVEPDLDHASLRADAIEDQVFGQTVRFCGYEHLIAMKEAAARDQDLVDLARLRELRGEG